MAVEKIKILGAVLEPPAKHQFGPFTKKSTQSLNLPLLKHGFVMSDFSEIVKQGYISRYMKPGEFK